MRIMTQVVRTYLEESLQSKKGITFYVNGNTMAGYVTRIIDEEAVEIRNQQSTKAVILIDRIDGMQLS
jgi:hypothetical protein